MSIAYNNKMSISKMSATLTLKSMKKNQTATINTTPHPNNEIHEKAQRNFF